MNRDTVLFEVRLTAGQWARLWQLAQQFEMMLAMDGDDSHITPADIIRDIADARIELLGMTSSRAPMLARIEALVEDGRLDTFQIAESVGCSPSVVAKISRQYSRQRARSAR